MDVFQFLQSDTALFGFAALALFMWKKIDNGGASQYILPVTLQFLQNWLKPITDIALYAVGLIVAVPFLLQLGFPVFLVIIAAVAFVLKDAVGWPLEQSLALAALSALIIGNTF